MKFLMQFIHDTCKRSWFVFVNGKPVDAKFVSIHSLFGTLTYGLRPEGYDGWVFREQNGGGAVTLPYAISPDDRLFIGLLLEDRPNMGPDPVWCAIGGFVDPGETHDETQKREAEEETGLNTAKATKLNGMGINSNRTFFLADASKGEGVQAYGLRIPLEWIEKDKGDGGYKLTANALPDFKKSENLRFFPWRTAVGCTADALALGAIAQLVAMVER